MIIKRVALLIAFFLTSLSLFSQVEAEFIYENPTDQINDGIATVKVNKGEPPYQYKWNFQHIPLTSNKAKNIKEGTSFHVTVYDSKGDSTFLKGKVPATTVEEKINGTLVPVVGFMEEIMFFDPFATIGIYDPVVYADEVPAISPEWDDSETVTLRLEKWFVAEGARVEKNQEIAEISVNDERTVIAKSPFEGTLNHDVAEGEIFYDINDKALVIDQTSHHIATLVYDAPQPVLHPNGDQMEVKIPFIVIWLVFGALFFTLKMRFVNFRSFKHAIELARGKFSDPKDRGEVSHFQALTTALSATVGLGNIAGVAIAISVGGAGATFWMIVAGLIGMGSKFVECTLGVKYRTFKKDGEVAGGPMYYLSKGLEKRNLKGLGKVLAMVFAILCIGGSLGGGNMFQSNQAFKQLSTEFAFLEGNGALFGIFMAILVGVVIVGGIKSIAKITDKIVPFMAISYVLAALTIIFINYTNISGGIMEIYNGAFNATALQGGFIGVLIVGFQRAAFSNEAGVGSAAIAFSATKTKEPVSNGIVAMLSPFIDTVVVCTMTALVLIFTGFADGSSGLEGSELTSAAFGSVVPWFATLLVGSIFLFAFSTMISWSYYGLKAWSYIFGETKLSGNIYKVIFLIFVVVGASAELGAVLDFSDLMVLGMAFPNILGLLIMSSEVRKDMKSYFERIRAGAIKRFK